MKKSDEIGREIVRIVEEVKKELGVDNKGLANLLKKNREYLDEDEEFLKEDEEIRDYLLNPKFASVISIDYLAEIVDLLDKKLVLKTEKRKIRYRKL